MATAYAAWIRAKGWEQKIPIKKPTPSEAVLFEKLVALDSSCG